MVEPVYVITNGEAAYNVFNAVAAFCQSASFHIIIGIGALCGITGAIGIYVRGKDPMIFMSYFGWFFLVTIIMTGLTFNVQIIDMTDVMADYNVANVPAGVVIPAHLISEVMEGITQVIDDVFHTSTDFNYLSTGMLYGSQVMEASLAPPPLNKDQQQEVDDYYRQCILPDILMNHKYTFNDLATQTDLVTFLTANASPVRGIYMPDQTPQFQTCQAAIAILGNTINQNTNLQLLTMQNNLSNSIDLNLPAGQFATDLQNAYSYYLSNLSEDAGTILLQNTMINGIRQAAMDNAANYNSDAAEQINQTQVTAEQSLLLEMLTLPKILANWLPFIQTVGFLMGICLFPLVVLFLMIPGGVAFSYLRGYVGFFGSICSWPAIYDLTNFVTNWMLSDHLPNRLEGASGITLSNIDQMQYYNTIAYGIAGFIAIAFTVGGIFSINKIGSVMQGATQNLIGFARSTTSGIATSTAEGDLSYGNMSAFNGNANKTDLNDSFTYGMQSTTNPNTGMTDKFWDHDGKSEFIGSDASNFMVGGNYNVNFAQETSAQLQQMASQTRTAAQSTMTQAASNLSSNLQQLDQFTSQVSDDKTLNTMFSQDHTGQFTQSYQAIQSSLNRYGEEHGWSHQQTNDVSKNLALGISADAQASVGAEKSVGPANVGASVGVGGHAGLTRTATEGTTNSLSSNYIHSLTQEQLNQFENQRHNIQSYMSQMQSMQSQGMQLSKGDQLIANISKDMNLMNQASAEFSQSQQYETMANGIQNTSASFNQNMMPQFEKWLKNNATTDPVATDAYYGLLNKERGMNISNLDSQALSMAQDKFVNSQLPNLGDINNQISGSANNVASQGSSWQSEVEAQGGIGVRSNATLGQSSVNRGYSNAGGSFFSGSGFNANVSQVEDHVSAAEQAVKQGGQSVVVDTQAGEQSVSDNTAAIDKNEDRGLWATEMNNAKKHVD